MLRYVLLLLCCGGYLIGFAQPGADQRPPLLLTRFSEDYAFLRDSTKRTERWDNLKFIALNDRADHYLTLGADLRYLYDRRENPENTVQHYHLLRAMAHADIHLGRRWRFFVQPSSNQLFAGNGMQRPIDEDRLFLLNAFADIGLGAVDADKWQLRLGRFEMNYGAGRFVTVREGPNLRQYWEGARLRHQTQRWRADAWLTEYGNIRPGSFDNPILDSPQIFWGGYLSRSEQDKPTIDAYYLGLRTADRFFFAVAGREIRHTFGVRLAGKASGWDYDFDLAAQTGNTNGQAIRAWGLGSTAGYTYTLGGERTLRAGLKLDTWSGDRDSTDTRNNSFNPMYPRQGYYQGAGALFPSNFIDVHPSLTFVPAPRWRVHTSVSWYWRTSTQDGIYLGGAGIPGLPPVAPDKQYLGRQVDITTTYHPSRNSYLTLIYSHFGAGEFVVQNRTPAEIRHFVNLILSYRI